MEFHENDYVLGVWFACKENGDDWMMTIVKRNNEWLGEYRFRYKEDEKIFHSKDRKSFYSLQISSTEKEDDIIKKINELFNVIKLHYNHENEFVEIKGNMEKFMFQLAQRPWAHIKHINTNGMSKEEIEKELGKELPKQSKIRR